MLRKTTIVALTLAAVSGAGLPLMDADAAEPGAISGVAFQDANRNGVLDAGESPWSAHVLYLFDATGAYVKGTQTDAQGRYRFDAVPAGTYVVEYAADRWWELRETWVPSTTGSVLPKQPVVVDGPAVADFGWRPIVRSTTAGQPVTSYTGPTGLRVESYNDVVMARDLHDTVVSGTVGAEAASTVVLFALSGSSTTTTSIAATAGRYDRFAASVYVSWLSWLDGGPETLSHEYGHAWGMYRAYLVQQDPALSGYLAARGVAGDPRLDTSYAWARDEMLAEDYRQLLGPAAARTTSQANSDVPAAAAVPGLREYLLGEFSGSTTQTPAPTTSPTTSPTPSPSPTASTTPTESPAPSASPVVSPSPSPTAKRKGSCRRAC